MSWGNGEVVAGFTIGNAQSRAAVYSDGSAEIVPLEEGDRAMPSAVLLHRLREVGKYAYLYSGTDANLLITSINRLLGRSYPEASRELANSSIEYRNEQNRLRICDWLGGLYSPIDLYAMVLRKLKHAVERYMHRPVTHAVIAVPGSFDDYQRRSARIAAESVFRYVKLINEPTAAAIALDSTLDLPRGQHMMTFDLGAGKCEIAILQQTREARLRIKAISGDTHLGGDDIDYLIFNDLAQKFHETHQEPLIGESMMARHEVLMAVRAAKHQLSETETAQINVPFVNFDRSGRPLHLAATITRTQLTTLTENLRQRIARLLAQCRDDAGSPILNRILILGGSTRLPFIAPLIERYCGKLPTRVANPDELAVLGACLYGAHLANQRHTIEIEDVTAHSLGITTYTGNMGFVLQRQSKIPAAITKRFVTVEENQSSVHIEVREGEYRQASSNRIIGEFYLPLPPRLPRSSPIEVTIGKDDDGIVMVRAHDLAAGNTREITITYDL